MNVNIKNKMTIIGLAAGLVFWLVHSAVNGMLDGSGFLVNLLNPTGKELWTRLFVLTVLTASGAYVQSNISKRIKDEAKLRESEARKTAILNTTVDAIITINETGIIQSFNPAAERMFGYSKDETIGNKVNMLMPEPYRTEHDTYLNNYVTTGMAKIIGIGREVRARRKDGTEIPIELAVSEVRFGGTRIFTGIIRDISERKALEHQKADFYAMVSHDMKSPLTVILGYSELMLGGHGSLDPEVMEMAEAISKNSRRIMNMLEDFLAISRLESGRVMFNIKLLDPADVLAAVKEQFLPLARQKGVELKTEIEDGVSAIHADKGFFARAINNLVQNAITYTPAGGSVTVRAGLHGSGTVDHLAVTVSDTGAGIPEDEREKIFEKYYRSPKSTGIKGSGLGLAIAKAVAEGHGGRIELDSEPGKGSTFRLVVPLSHTAARGGGKMPADAA